MAGSLNKDGQKYAERSNSSMISFLLNENADNCRWQMEAKGIKPKDHHRQNLKNMREKQKLAKLAKENQANMANMKKKSTKYSKIDSKLKQTLSANPSSASLSRTQNTNYLLKNKAKIQCQSSLNSCVFKKDKVSTARKPAIPTRSELKITVNHHLYVFTIIHP